MNMNKLLIIYKGHIQSLATPDYNKRTISYQKKSLNHFMSDPQFSRLIIFIKLNNSGTQNN